MQNLKNIHKFDKKVHEFEKVSNFLKFHAFETKSKNGKKKKRKRKQRRKKRKKSRVKTGQTKLEEKEKPGSFYLALRFTQNDRTKGEKRRK